MVVGCPACGSSEPRGVVFGVLRLRTQAGAGYGNHAGTGTRTAGVAFPSEAADEESFHVGDGRVRPHRACLLCPNEQSLLDAVQVMFGAGGRRLDVEPVAAERLGQAAVRGQLRPHRVYLGLATCIITYRHVTNLCEDL